MEGQISIFDVLAGQDSDQWNPKPGDLCWFFSGGRLNWGTYEGEADLMQGVVILRDDNRQRWFLERRSIYPSPAAAKERSVYA